MPELVVGRRDIHMHDVVIMIEPNEFYEMYPGVYYQPHGVSQDMHRVWAYGFDDEGLRRDEERKLLTRYVDFGKQEYYSF